MPNDLPGVGDYVEFYSWSLQNPVKVGEWNRGLVLSYRKPSYVSNPIWHILGENGEVYKHVGMIEDTDYEIKLIQRRSG